MTSDARPGISIVVPITTSDVDLEPLLRGYSAAMRQTGLGFEFVFVLDADNEIRPRCIEVLVAALDQSSAGFAYSIIEQFGQVQSLTGCDAWSPRLLARGNYIDAMALLRRDTWLRVGGYRAMRTPGWEDFDFWCRCVEAQVDGLLVPEILCRYRVHAKSMLRRTTDTLRNHLLVCDELRKAHPWVEF